MLMILEISTSISSVRTNISNQKFRLNQILNKGFIFSILSTPDLGFFNAMHIERVD